MHCSGSILTVQKINFDFSVKTIFRGEVTVLQGKTILITGATGLLGSNLTKECLDRGARVIALGRSEEKLKGCFAEYLGTGSIVFVAADISNMDFLFSEPVDYIFHAAGSIEFKTIVNKPMDIIAPNVMGTISCLNLLRQTSPRGRGARRLVYFSSEAVYGRNETDRTVSEDDTAYTDSLQMARSPYSQSKRMAEVIINGYVKQYGVDAVNVRLSWIYGNARYRSKQALFDFIGQALAGKDILIRNPNTPRRDNLYMADAMSALLLVAEKGISGETYNISSNGDKGNYAGADEIAETIVDIINKKYGKNSKVIYEFQPSKREGGVKMDNSKIKQIGWDVSVSLYEGMSKLIEEIKDSVY